MRVAHLHRMRGIGGSERHLLTLLPALGEHGLEPVFIGLDDPASAPEPFYAQLSEAGVPFVRLACPRDLDPALARSVVRAVRRVRPALVHTHLVHADVYGALAAVLTRTALVSTKHNDDRFRVGPFRFVEQALTRRAARVIAITHALARFNVEHVGLPEDKIDVVHYGLDRLPEPWGANEPVALPPDARVLLAISRLVEQKGIDVAVQALAELRREHRNAVLVVLGEGPSRASLEALAGSLGVEDAVFLPGRAGDVAWWLRRAELLVHPARWEGFGLALLEAMLAELPIVATGVSAIPEIVADGETGLLVAPDDPPALARALRRVLAEPELAARLGRAALERARAEFSVERMARRTLDVYEAAASSEAR